MTKRDFITKIGTEMLQAIPGRPMKFNMDGEANGG